MPEGTPVGVPVGVPVGCPEAAPEGAPEGAPLGAAPVGMPDGAWQFWLWPELPLEDEESPEPQATRARGESANRATAGTRRTRFMRDSSKHDEGVLRCGHSTNGG
ncbi:hypothetical protein AQJ64_27670 [Streptomyces griseoruber]|uniref:Uncharacterized protein n=1 Tax=Streptomyces griseoruber TaxID=1943 RepID=A0A101SSR8_9ACTN|nr:hypothetical protein AQJ64_27670 [Streptomyces griseoruber]